MLHDTNCVLFFFSLSGQRYVHQEGCRSQPHCTDTFEVQMPPYDRINLLPPPLHLSYHLLLSCRTLINAAFSEIKDGAFAHLPFLQFLYVSHSHWDVLGMGGGVLWISPYLVLLVEQLHRAVPALLAAAADGKARSFSGCLRSWDFSGEEH